MAICKKCGEPINELDLFCSKCGEKVGLEVPVEKVKYVLSTSKKEGLVKQILCYLVFYDDEIIFAYLSKERQNLEYKKHTQELKDSGAKLLTRIGSNLQFFENYGVKYYQMSKEDILKEESKNFSVKYGQIKKVKFSRPKMVHYNDGDFKENIGNLIITLPNEKLKFTHKNNDKEGIIKIIFKKNCAGSFKYI